jgi:hypothetical protein
VAVAVAVEGAVAVAAEIGTVTEARGRLIREIEMVTMVPGRLVRAIGMGV